MALRCDACGMNFANEREMQEHARMHVSPPTHVDYSCGCGASFHTEAELKQHAAAAHGM